MRKSARQPSGLDAAADKYKCAVRASVCVCCLQFVRVLVRWCARVNVVFQFLQHAVRRHAICSQRICAERARNAGGCTFHLTISWHRLHYWCSAAATATASAA